MWTDEKALAIALVEMARSAATHDSLFLMQWRDHAGWEQLTEDQALAACDFLDRRLGRGGEEADGNQKA